MTLLSVAQMNSQNNIEANFLVIESLIQQSKANGAELIVFPENFVCFAAGKQRETAAQFEDIQKRLSTWQAPEPNVKRGVLAKYAKTVGSASEGAITDKF